MVEGVEVSLNGEMSMTMVTDTDGSYHFDELMTGFDYSVTPYLNANPLNGVTTFDLVLMSKHILGTQLLDSPYKLIAADINMSNTITTFDMIQLRKLILNIETAFTNNTSWRFVETAYSFPQPTNPWYEVFPELINENNLNTDILDADFVGVKIGDVNGSAQANALSVDDRSLKGIFKLEVENISMKAGNTYTVAVTASELVEGFQGTLALNGAELVDIEYGELQAQNFGLRFVDQGMITTSFNSEFTADDVLFSLVIRATQDAELSEVLSINSAANGRNYTAAEAYTLPREGDVSAEPIQSELMDVGINFSNGVEEQARAEARAEARFELYQNIPNPFEAETLIGFTIPDSDSNQNVKATLTISEISGKVLAVITTDASAGYNTITVTREMIQYATGVLSYTLSSGEYTATRTMVVVR
jgi:hypothetical protein